LRGFLTAFPNLEITLTSYFEQHHIKISDEFFLLQFYI